MDLLDIKARIAQALVESVFRRAGFTLTPVGPRESPSRLGRGGLVPDFFAVRVPPAGKPPQPPARPARRRPRGAPARAGRGGAGPRLLRGRGPPRGQAPRAAGPPGRGAVP